MIRYKTREGVVLTSICGESLLVSATALHGICPSVTTLNDSSAFLWKELQKGAGLEDLEKAVLAEYEIDDVMAVRIEIESFILQMLETNYLLEFHDDGMNAAGI